MTCTPGADRVQSLLVQQACAVRAHCNMLANTRCQTGRGVPCRAGPPVSAFQKRIRNGATVLTDHICKEMNELNLERCSCIPRNVPGADWRVLLEIVAADPSRETFKVLTAPRQAACLVHGPTRAAQHETELAKLAAACFQSTSECTALVRTSQDDAMVLNCHCNRARLPDGHA